MEFIDTIKPQVDLTFNPCFVEYFSCLSDDYVMDTTIGKIIASKLKSLRKSQGWLAEEVGVSINAVSKWTRTGKISREKAILVATVLDLSLDQLVGRDIADTNGELEEVGLERVSPDEAELLQRFRLSTKEGKSLIKIMADSAPKIALPATRRGTNKA